MAARKHECRTIVMATTIELGAVNGPSIHLLSLTRALDKLGYQVELIAPRPSAPLPLELPPTIGLHTVANVRHWGMPSAVSIMLMLRPLYRLRRLGPLYVRSGAGTVLLTWLARLLGYS